METYDPKRVIVTFAGQTINAGIADGTFISITRTNRTSTLRGGSDGGQTRVINNDRNATCEITYRATAQVNDLLRDNQQQEDADPPQYTVSAFKLEDLNGRTLVSDPNAFIDGPPDMEFSQDEPSRVWRILLPNPVMNNRGGEPPLRTPAI